MRIKLINPAQLDATGQPIKISKEVASGLTLPYLAALIPGRHNISIAEESMEKIDFDEPVDLVGLTAITCRAPRAYWIAGQYKKRGVPTVMGGFHATALPEEALLHCDAVVKGEAEGIIEQVVEDASAGRMKGVYERKTRHDLRDLPVPRYDLINMKNFFMPVHPVQVTRGCPYHCDFCSVTSLFGSRHRKRPLEDVLRDINATGPFLNFVDDNLTADKKYALSLFNEIKPLNKAWIGQADIRAASDGELIHAASAAGCRALYLGIETLNKKSLLATKKTPNLSASAEKALRQLKRHHIEPFVSMIIGFEADTMETAREIVDFCNRQRVPILFLYILTPPPGSPIYQRMEANHVPFKKDWHLYDGTHSVFDTPQLSSGEMEALYMTIQKEIYSLPSIIQRTFFPPHFLMLFMNLWARQNINSQRHPWMGNSSWVGLLEIIAKAGAPLVGPTARKISRLIRFTEGRLTN